MTSDEIMKMRPGRELDAIVAEKMMGWEYFPAQVTGTFVRLGYFFDPVSGEAHHHWSPSTDISAAWEVVEKFEYIDVRSFKDHYGCTVYGKTMTGKTAPEAICKAALLAVMGEEVET